ncbi:MAG: hypothetical protein MR434_08905, partial [Ruminococcus sp.]|nr:hypothetical protein [Ruminococcus sp.]
MEITVTAFFLFKNDKYIRKRKKEISSKLHSIFFSIGMHFSNRITTNEQRKAITDSARTAN